MESCGICPEMRLLCFRGGWQLSLKLGQGMSKLDDLEMTSVLGDCDIMCLTNTRCQGTSLICLLICHRQPRSPRLYKVLIFLPQCALLYTRAFAFVLQGTNMHPYSVKDVFNRPLFLSWLCIYPSLFPLPPKCPIIGSQIIKGSPILP